jgi:hypothetical protein
MLCILSELGVYMALLARAPHDYTAMGIFIIIYNYVLSINHPSLEFLCSTVKFNFKVRFMT